MKKLTKRILVMLLCLVMTVQMCMPVSALDGETEQYAEEFAVAVMQNDGLLGKTDYSKYIKTFEKVNNVLGKFSSTKEYAKVFAKLIKYANSANSILGVISSLYEKLHGGGNGATETPVTLETLYDGIQEIQASLSQVNRKLDDITYEILNMEISQEEHNRANIASSESSNLNVFSANHCKPLDTYVEKYQTELDRAFKKWYTDPSVRGDNADVVLLHAIITDSDGNKSQSLLMSDAANPTGVVETDTGIDADPTLTVIIPAEALENLPSYNIDCCVDNFRDAVYRYEIGQGADEETAKLYAQEAYETLIYRLGCAVVQDEGIWRTSFDGIKTAFTAYLTATLGEHTGLNAQLQLMYNVYGFEGEARDNINMAADQMIARTTLYGMFVLDLLAKNGLTTSSEMTSLMDNWTNTINAIDQMRNDSLTGYDDFCYLTGTRLIPVSAQLYASNYTTFAKSNESLSSVYKIIHSNDLWNDTPEGTFRIKITGPDGLYINTKYIQEFASGGNIADTVTTVMLYHLYESSGQDSSLAAYLTRCGANEGGYIKEDDIRPIMTKYTATEELASKDAESFTLTAKTLRGSDFTDGKTYDLSSISKTRWNNFDFRHKVTGASVNSGTGSMDVDATLATAFGYRTNEMNRDDWCPKNVTDFSTSDTKIVGKRNDYKDIGNYKTSFDDTFYRDLYILYRQPVSTSNKNLLQASSVTNASNAPNPLEAYLLSAQAWMQSPPDDDLNFTHTPVDQSKVRIANDMGDTSADRMTEYEALIRDEAARAGQLEPSQQEIDTLKTQMEECWQEIWSTTNSCKALLESVPIELTDLEMKELVSDVINRGYTDDPEEGVEEFSVENVDMRLMDENDMNLYLRISPRTAVEFKDGKYQVISCFDVTPVLLAHSYFVEDGSIKLTEDFEQPLYIGDQLSHDLKFNIILPVTERSLGNVDVRHFDNWFTFQEDEVYNAEVKTDLESRYVSLTDALTGPLSVKGDYLSIVYHIILGTEQTVFTDADSAKFASDADFSKFDHVEVDGRSVEKKYYAAESGSTVVTFNQDFIKTLEVGKHSIEIVSSDGSASTGFTVKAKQQSADPVSPQTGDNSMFYLWLMLLAGSGAVLTGITTINCRKKKQD